MALFSARGDDLGVVLGRADALRREVLRRTGRVTCSAYGGLTVRTCGNASVRIADGDAVLIKGTGVCMGDMTAGDAVLVSLDGRVHAHPPYATAWAADHRVPPSASVAARDVLGPIALVDVAAPGSARLAALVIAAFSSPGVRAALLSEHGTVTVAEDLHTAVHLTEHFEDVAKVERLAASVAGLPGLRARVA
ncbi:MAG TPA: class II aldolase/adducin family protein [Baekduia sp.]|nr:class II aldolase/adducin family protein [Baekduia sp.]